MTLLEIALEIQQIQKVLARGHEFLNQFEPEEWYAIASGMKVVQ